MKAEELRIGNWVKHKVEEWSYRNDDGVISTENNDCFKWEESDWYAIGECTLSLQCLEPIPLTEEWLLKFGFKKSKPTLTVNYISNCGLMTIYKMPNGKFFADGVINDIYLPYVHTTQNLYFALTNKEL